MTNEELQILLDKAKEETTSGRYDEAEFYASEVLAELDRSENEREQSFFIESQRAEAHLCLASSAYSREMYGIALEQAQQVLGVAQTISLTDLHPRANNILGNVYRKLGNYGLSLEYFGQSLKAYEELGEKSRVAVVLVNMGLVFSDLASYDRALECFSKALGLNEQLQDKSRSAQAIRGIGLVYYGLGNYDYAYEYFLRALTVSSEIGEIENIASDTGNIGNVFFNLEKYAEALEYMYRALEVHEKLAQKSSAARVSGNIANVLSLQGKNQEALKYYNKALEAHEELSEKIMIASVSQNLAMLYLDKEFEGHDESLAEEFLLKSLSISESIGAKQILANTHSGLASLYKSRKLWEQSLMHFERFHVLELEVENEEAKKRASQIEHQRQIAEREKEIAIAKATADAQMSATTTLLHKVLPESVATRMIKGETEIADYFTNVSILFADIAGFTPISADMPAIVVVRFLNYVFGEFDRIVKKHGCEKIKTIGDGYMAIAGAPIECADHAERLAAAALEMQETITLPESIHEYMPGGEKLGVRIGLHTGSVVAGVIGEERFVYDIYSDAVNTAARMESHGEENKIHVSNDFFRHLQNRFAMTKNASHGLVFEKRGEMEIKGKGIMRTYFLEKV